MSLVLTAWLYLVVTSLLSEIHSQWVVMCQKHETQSRWTEECRKPSYWALYPEECLAHASASRASFYMQWIEAVARNTKWCGVDQCEDLLTRKSFALFCFVYALFGPVPRLVRYLWRRIYNAPSC
jgi:hypothetical protein